MSRKTAYVLGHPVAHSKSPRLHSYWIDRYGLQGCAYDRKDVPPDQLAAFLKNPGSDVVGVNLTVPLKEKAVEIVEALSPLARRIGAVNTVTWRADGTPFGDNTDAFGFMENLRTGAPDFDPAGKTAVVLGAGGASRAVCAGLVEAGIGALRLVNRTRETAQMLAADIGGPITVVDFVSAAEALTDADLLVNTTVLGMVGKPALELDLAALPKTAVVTDIVYTPLMTDLLKTAAVRGNPIVDGLGMLLYQAVPAFEAFFGHRPEVTPALRDHMLAGADA